jgi:hypothetical protein
MNAKNVTTIMITNGAVQPSNKAIVILVTITDPLIQLIRLISLHLSKLSQDGLLFLLVE